MSRMVMVGGGHEVITPQSVSLSHLRTRLADMSAPLNPSDVDMAFEHGKHPHRVLILLDLLHRPDLPAEAQTAVVKRLRDMSKVERRNRNAETLLDDLNEIYDVLLSPDLPVPLNPASLHILASTPEADGALGVVAHHENTAGKTVNLLIRRVTDSAPETVISMRASVNIIAGLLGRELTRVQVRAIVGLLLDPEPYGWDPDEVDPILLGMCADPSRTHRQYLTEQEISMGLVGVALI